MVSMWIPIPAAVAWSHMESYRVADGVEWSVFKLITPFSHYLTARPLSAPTWHFLPFSKVVPSFFQLSMHRMVKNVNKYLRNTPLNFFFKITGRFTGFLIAIMGVLRCQNFRKIPKKPSKIPKMSQKQAIFEPFRVKTVIFYNITRPL